MQATDRRVEIVNEHMRLENAYDFPACISEFSAPKYEVVADGELFDGQERVHQFLAENHRAFPDFEFVPTRVSPTTDAVLVEGRFKGTHLGNWRGLPATGKKVDFAMCLIFEFDGTSMINEKLYFDLSSPLRQLGVVDNLNGVRGKLTLVLTHPIVIVKAAIFSLTRKLRGKKT